MDPLDLKGGDVTAVAVHNNLVAATIKAKTADAPGMVKLFDTNGNLLATFETGSLPDNVAFSPNGCYLLTANDEGEPSDDYAVDPEGSFTLVDLRAGVNKAKITQISMEGVDARPEVGLLRPAAALLLMPNPEYVAFAPDGKSAYVTLQENNAVAVIDVETSQVVKVFGLGVKNASETMPTICPIRMAALT